MAKTIVAVQIRQGRAGRFRFLDCAELAERIKAGSGSRSENSVLTVRRPWIAAAG
jgi:hypothetical protein